MSARLNAASPSVVTSKPPKSDELSSPMCPLAKLTSSTCPWSIIRRICSSFSGAVNIRLSNGSARNAPTLGRNRRIHHHDIGKADDGCDRCNIADEIEIELVVKRRVDCARRAEEA